MTAGLRLDCGAVEVEITPVVLLEGDERLDASSPGAALSVGGIPSGDAEVVRLRWPGRCEARLTVRRAAPGRHLVAIDVIADGAVRVEAAGLALSRRDGAGSRLLVDGFHSWDWAGVRDTGSAGRGWWGGLWGEPGSPDSLLALSPVIGEVLSVRWEHGGTVEALYCGTPAQERTRSGAPRSLGWRLSPGDSAGLGTLRLGAPHPSRAAALPWIDRVTEPTSAAGGWMSWNCLGAAVTPDDVIAAATDLVPPGGIVLLDDGWMRIWGDWVENERFARGLSDLAAALTAVDRRLGLWVAPFAVDPRSTAATTNAAMLFRSVDGDPVVDNRPAAPQWALDPRRPEVRTHLFALGQRLGRSGVSALKADFLYQGALEPRPGALAALRRGIGALADGFRSRAGDAAPVWACGAPAAAVVGIADACRSGGDAVLNVPAANAAPPEGPTFVTGAVVRRAQERNLGARSWLWGAQLPCDVDAVSAGPLSDAAPAIDSATLDRWMRLATLSGGPRMVSDRAGSVERDHADRLRKWLATSRHERQRPVDPLAMAAADGDDFLAWQDGLPEHWSPY